MGYKLRFVVFLSILAGSFNLKAQNDTVATRVTSDSIQTVRRVYAAPRIDSATLARMQQVRDSLTWFYLKPDPKRKNLFVAEMLKKHIVKDPTFLSQAQPSKENTYGTGKALPRYLKWEFFILLGLLIAFAALRLAFKKQMELVFQAFYNDRSLAQINKEENLFNSWYFLLSFLLFSLFVGFFIYLFLERYTGNDGTFSLFLYISIFFALFLGLKIVSLRFLGYFFYVQRLTKEYINSIYLSFFNVSLFLIPLTICFALSVGNGNWILFGGAGIILLAFGLQMLRVIIHILNNYKVSKFYLILYLCTFELCPIIVIVKALTI